MQQDGIQSNAQPKYQTAALSPKLVTVIIPSLHRPDLLKRTLEYLAQQTLAQSQFDVVVVENQARQNCLLQASLPDNVRCILLSANLGTTGSINHALQQSSSRYVLLLNNDVELGAGFLECLVSTLQENEQYGFATGKLLNGRRRDTLDGAGDALLCGGAAYRLGHDDTDHGQFDVSREVLAGCGAATLFRRSVLREIGGLDEDFFAYLDDMDLALRSQIFGHKGIYVPQAIAYHLGSATLGDTFHPRIAQLLTRNQLYLLFKDYPAAAVTKLSLHIVAFQLLWLALLLRRGLLLSYVRGFGGALLRAPKMLRKRRQLMRSRSLTSAQFIARLRASEQQIFEWQASLPRAGRSTVLATYFRLFKPVSGAPNREAESGK